MCMVDTRFLASTDATIHLRQQAAVNHLEQHQARLLIQNLLMCGMLFLLVQLLDLKKKRERERGFNEHQSCRCESTSQHRIKLVSVTIATDPQPKLNGNGVGGK